jgi:hypothetical protein
VNPSQRINRFKPPNTLILSRNLVEYHSMRQTVTNLLIVKQSGMEETNESSPVSKDNVRKMQNHPPQRARNGDLQ